MHVTLSIGSGTWVSHSRLRESTLREYIVVLARGQRNQGRAERSRTKQATIRVARDEDHSRTREYRICTEPGNAASHETCDSSFRVEETCREIQKEDSQ